MSTYNSQDDASSGTPLFDQTGSVPPVGGSYEPVAGEFVPAEIDSPSVNGSSDDSGKGSSDSSAADAAKQKAGAAKDEAGKVAGDAKEQASHVAGVTKEQAGQVASEVKSQAKDLYNQATSELKDQAGTQSQKVAEGLRSVSDELSSMADRSDGNGVASQLVKNLSGRAGSAATWLDGRDPGSLLDEVKSYAARKPGTFIAIAAGAGILAGRLAKSLAAEAKSEAAPIGSTTSGSTDLPHEEPTTAPADGYTRTAEPVGVVPASSEYDEYADTRTFDALVEGTPVTRPLGEDR